MRGYWLAWLNEGAKFSIGCLALYFATFLFIDDLTYGHWASPNYIIVITNAIIYGGYLVGLLMLFDCFISVRSILKGNHKLLKPKEE